MISVTIFTMLKGLAIILGFSLTCIVLATDTGIMLLFYLGMAGLSWLLGKAFWP